MEKIALTPRSQALIKNYLIGGAALGGSGALLTSLINYINTLKQQAPKDPEREDDDTLYLNVGGNKVATQQSSGATDLAAGGLALTGGLLSTLGTYALVRKLYQNIKKKQLQEELDRAQNSFLGATEEEASAKVAGLAQPAGGQPMGKAEFLWSAPVAFALLSAIAAGALTNKALDKTFPRVKKPTNSGPKKVVIRKTPKALPEEAQEQAEYDKMASEDQHTDGLEFLMHLCMGSKSASKSELVDIVHAVAQGRGPDMVQHMLEYGFDSAMDTIKGASETPITAFQKQMAISYCVKNASLYPVVELLAAAEYNDMAPRFTKVASLQNEECFATLLKVAGAMGAINRADLAELGNLEFTDADEAKEASAMSLSDILAAINELSAGGAGGSLGESDEVDQNDNINTEDSIDSGEEKQVNDRKPLANNKISPDVINELDSDDDFIDQAMSAPITPAKALAADTK